MATITAAKAGSWSATDTWVGGQVPVAGDTADLNGFVVAMDVNAIPVGGGSLLALVSPGKAGQLTVNLDVLGASSISATTITCGTVGSSAGIIAVSGNNTLTVNTTTMTGGASSFRVGLTNSGVGSIVVNGSVSGGSATSAYGIHNASTGSITVNNGSVSGGSGNTSSGINSTSAGSVVTLNNCNLIYTLTAMAVSGFPPVYNPGPSNYVQFGITKFPQQLAAGLIASGTVHGDITGTRVDCPVAKAVSTSGNYGDPATPLVGTYHEPDASEVWHTAVFGPLSATHGTKVGSSIPNLTANNIRRGVTVDDVTGTLRPFRPFFGGGNF